MRGSLTTLSLIAFVVALAAWVGLWFLFSDVSARLSARAEALSSAGVQSEQQQKSVELKAIIADTAQARTQLDAAVSTDVVGIAGDITAAGTAAGVQTTIGSATVVSSADLPAQADVNELTFVVQATGSFQQVWRAAQLFQTLPLPSSVSELDFEQLPSDGKASQWQLTATINVLTSAQVSS